MKEIKPINNIQFENPANRQAAASNPTPPKQQVAETRGSTLQAAPGFSSGGESDAQAPPVAQAPPSSDTVQLPAIPQDSVSHIYPTPLSPEERVANSEERRRNRQSNRPFIVFVVSILGMLAGMYSLYQTIKVVFFNSIAGTRLIGFSLFTDDQSVTYWLLSTLLIVEALAIIYASYTVWKGSFAGLALLTGLSFKAVYSVVITIDIVINNPDVLANIPVDNVILLSLYPAFYIALILCWLQRKRYFV